MNKYKGKLFIISAPSGVGKTSLVIALCEKYGCMFNLERIITYTSRNPRIDEINGFHYYFLSKSDFEKKIESGFFLEWSCDYGSHYGSPRHILKDLTQGKSYIVILDRKGARSLKSYFKNSILIWIKPPSLETLKFRLSNRATGSENEIQRRLELAKIELESEETEKFFQYNLINENFDLTLNNLSLIVRNELKKS